MHPYFGENEADYPLHAAAAMGTVQDIKRVLDDPDHPEQRLFQDGIYGESPLHWSAARGDEEAVRLLLEEGICYANTPDRHCEGPGKVAKKFGHDDLAKLLEQEAYLECERGVGHKERRWRAKHRNRGGGNRGEGFER